MDTNEQDGSSASESDRSAIIMGIRQGQAILNESWRNR